MDAARGFSTLFALGGALLAAAVARPPAALAAAADPAPAPKERVLDVTFFPAGPASTQPASRRALVPATPPRPPAIPATAGAPAPAARIAGAAPAGRAENASSRAAAGGALLAGIAVAVVAVAGARLAWRRRPRRCSSCHTAMRLLAREAAFAELDMAERTEHLVGDVHYEVWRCDGCGAIGKRGAARDLSRLKTGAGGLAAPVGSAAFLRRRAQSGLSIWSPPAKGDGQLHVTATPSSSSTRRSTRSGP
ncbi:MAG TPA: hypothetical protein VHG32_23415 [Thermoanaerobaculia bacterium]|jgi:hypothetical protein|nr:hypothetical protein [Thermoanaerobaculia bacterium]